MAKRTAKKADKENVTPRIPPHERKRNHTLLVFTEFEVPALTLSSQTAHEERVERKKQFANQERAREQQSRRLKSLQQLVHKTK
jgi:hypothetical protein